MKYLDGNGEEKYDYTMTTGDLVQNIPLEAHEDMIGKVPERFVFKFLNENCPFQFKNITEYKPLPVKYFSKEECKALEEIMRQQGRI